MVTMNERTFTTKPPLTLDELIAKLQAIKERHNRIYGYPDNPDNPFGDAGNFTVEVALHPESSGPLESINFTHVVDVTDMYAGEFEVVLHIA